MLRPWWGSHLVIIMEAKTKSSLAVVLLALVWLTYAVLGEDVPPEVKKATEEIIQASETPSEPQQEGYYTVTQVVDGDTVKVKRGGEIITLRLIGIDTPEIVDPRKPVQCFGKEASSKTKELLTGKSVRLEADATQGEKDKYDRLLRYLYLEDGTFFNKWMIEEGYAHEYTYDSNPYKYRGEFLDAQKRAQEGNRGFWSEGTCRGNTT